MQNKPKNISFNLRWHRRVGLSVTLMLVLLAITGVLLNHSPAAGLNKKILSSAWLLDWYGFETASLSGFLVGEKWLHHPGERALFLDTETVASCNPPLLSGVVTPEFLLALCTDELVILTSSGELVEKINLSNGLPKDTTNLGYFYNTTFIKSNSQILSLDLETLEILPSKTEIKQWQTSRSLPSEIRLKLNQDSQLPGISLETLILDLHSGRFFGNIGVLFFDFIGLLTCFLAITGLWSWLGRRKVKIKPPEEDY